jgi:ABC-type multidrug transport system fused ATPase/permease subunit
VIVGQIIFLRRLITFVESVQKVGTAEADYVQGVVAAVMISVCCALQPIAINNQFVWSFRVGLRAKAGVASVVWRKAVRLSPSGTNNRAGGISSLVNLVETDTQRLIDAFRYSHFLWSGLVELAVVTTMLCLENGPVALVAMSILFVAVPVQAVFAKRVGRIQRRAVVHTDMRTRLMNEVLSGIELIKTNAWELPFASKMAGVRGAEVGELRKSEMLKAWNLAVFQAAPLLAACVLFVIRTLVNGEELDAASAFSALAWMNFMMRTLIMVPRGAQAFSESLVSIRRIEEFLLLPEVEEVEAVQAVEAVGGKSGGGGAGEGGVKEEEEDDNRAGGGGAPALDIRGCAWSWNLSRTTLAVVKDGINGEIKETIAEGKGSSGGEGRGAKIHLQDISLSVGRGELVAVVGEIGAGKSSLLSAIMGEMHRCDHGKGTFLLRQAPSPSSATASVASPKRAARIRCVPQRAFIMCGSLRENITFGLEYDKARFDRAVRACHLKDDIDSFPGADLSEIGEGGTTLSGGQKQRVALARAVYASEGADLLLLDDVLSALDTKVAAKVFRDVLSREHGALRDFPCILVTHAPWAAARADKILDMGKEGSRPKIVIPSREGRAWSGSVVNETGAVGAAAEAAAELAAAMAAVAGGGSEINEQRKRNAGDETKAEGEKEVEVVEVVEVVGPAVAAAVENPAKEPLSERAVGETVGETAEALVETEESEEGVVTLKTWGSYVRAGGGACRFTAVILLFIFTQGIRVGCDWWVSRWTEGSFSYRPSTLTSLNLTANGSLNSSLNSSNATLGLTGPNLEPSDYALGYGMVVLAFTGAMFLRSVCFTMTMLRASQTLHDAMFARVLRAPMNWFWQQVTGRILNRFSKDMDSIDRLMVLAAQDFFNFFFIAVSKRRREEENRSRTRGENR